MVHIGIKIETATQSRNSSNMSRTCYNCHRQGHLSYDCPLKKNEKGKQGNFGLCIDKHKYIGDDRQEGKTVKLSGVAIDSDHNDKISPGLNIVKGTVEGNSVTVLRDTGSSTLFLHSNIVKDVTRTGKIKDICFADGKTRQCEEVSINTTSPYISDTIQVLVLDVPFADLVIGNFVNTSIPKDCTPEAVEEKKKNR